MRLYLVACYCLLSSSGDMDRVRLGLDLVSGCLMVMHTYLYYFPLSLALSLALPERTLALSVVT